MADPFGIVGVVGVIMQIAQALVQFGLDWKDAPREAKSFLAEIQTLKTVLSELNMNLSLNADFADAFQHHPSLILSQLGPNAPSNTDTKVMLRDCQSQLKSLLDELETRRKGHRLGWERFKGAFLAKEKRESMENLQRQSQMLNRMVTIDTAVLGAETHKVVREAREEQDQARREQQDWRRAEENKEILEWLTPINSGSRLSDFLNRHQEGTGRWLLDSGEFQRWHDGDGQTLFCPGMPGAGKTIMASVVIDHLCTKSQDDDRTGVAFLFFDFRRQHEQKLVDLLASLLKQLIPGLASIPKSVRSLYNRHRRNQTRPSSAEISKVLGGVMKEYFKTFLIIDALDECQLSDGVRQQFLSEILDLQVKTETNLFVTSRFISGITKELGVSTTVEIRASADDVRKYLDGNMSGLPSFVSRNLDLQNEIIAKIVEVVDGMFLLAYFHLDSLTKKKSPKSLREALRNLPRGSEALDHAYMAAMERIQGQSKESQDLAQQVLSWIICAKRPLTTIELQIAVSVEIGASEFDEENLHDIEDMISVCAGLVTLDEESDMLRLVHYTTQEYFDRTWETWFPDAQRVIARTCITYLSYRTFETGRCRTTEEFETRSKQNPLYNYAAKHWGHHTRISETEVDCFVLDFLESAPNVSGSYQALKDSWYILTGDEENLIEGGSLHLAAHFGLEKAMTALLKNGHDPESIDESRRTPLWWAAELGHEPVVQLLLNHGSNSTSKVEHVWGLLYYPVIMRNVGVVRILLTRADFKTTSEDEFDWTPLSFAIGYGDWDVANLFLLRILELLLPSIGHDGTAKLQLADDESATRWLEGATRYDAFEVLPKLLERRNHDDLLKSMQFEPFLWCAAAFGKATMVGLLLSLDGIDVNSQDSDGISALSWAAKNGHDAVIRLLLAVKGIDVNSQESDGRPALSWAAENGHEAVTRLLLAVEGIDVNSQDSDGRSALSRAAENGHEAVTRLLLAVEGIEVNSQDSDGRSALSRAAANGYDEAAVSLLLNVDGIGVYSQESDGISQLSLAAQRGLEAVVRLLLAVEGIDVNSQDSYGNSALSLATLRGHEAVVRLLLNVDGIDFNSPDLRRWPLLSVAACYSSEAIVMLLLAKGADVNARDGDGYTALGHAENWERHSIAELLRAHGANTPEDSDQAPSRQHDSSEDDLVVDVGPNNPWKMKEKRCENGRDEDWRYDDDRM